MPGRLAESSVQSAADVNIQISALAAFSESALPRLRARDESALAFWKTELSAIGAQLEREVERWRAKLSNAHIEGSEREGEARSRNEIEGRIDQIQRCARTIDNELEFCESVAGKALARPAILVDRRRMGNRQDALSLRRNSPTPPGDVPANARLDDFSVKHPSTVDRVTGDRFGHSEAIFGSRILREGPQMHWSPAMARRS